MVLEPPDVIDEGDLTGSDEQILDELHDGPLTKGAIVDRTGLHRNTVRNRLDVLLAGDVVKAVHERTKLYELADDPRDDTADEAELRARLQDALEARYDAQQRADELEADLEDCREQLEAAREGSVDTAAIRRAVDDLEAACERGDGGAVQDAIGRLREAIGE